MLYLKYQPNNWLTSQTLGSGVTTSYAYNPRGFLADLRTTAPQSSGGAVIAEFGGTVGTSSAMTYDAVGNRTRMAGVLNAVGGYQLLGNGPSSSQYAYNSANELTQEQTSQPGNGSYTNTYGYDGAQNRTTQNGTSIGHTVDNQLSASGAYAYDGNGNPTTYTSPGNSVNGNANAATFDPENRMTGYSAGGGVTATYDSDGLRASKTGSSATYYVYDEQDRPVVELNASGNVSAVNTFGDNGLLSRRDVSGGVTTYYAFDPQGSAVDVMQNGNGLPAAYSAFGVPASGGASGSPFGFGAQWGYYTDAETGLVLCTHRYYDPYTGRFLNRDPMNYKAGVNLYAYTKNDPINSTDPTGYASLIRVGPRFHPDHYYIVANCSGNPGDSWGFWPGGGFGSPALDEPGDIEGPGNLLGSIEDPHGPTNTKLPFGPGNGDGTPVLTDNDPGFVIELCKCIRKSQKHPPAYGVFPNTYVCYHWAFDIWDCALKATGLHGKRFGPGF